MTKQHEAVRAIEEWERGQHAHNCTHCLTLAQWIRRHRYEEQQNGVHDLSFTISFDEGEPQEFE